MSNFLFFLFILYLSKLLLAEQSPERIIQQGKLKGKFEESKSGRKFSAFTGIPYAKPPVKELRFKVMSIYVVLYLDVLYYTIVLNRPRFLRNHGKTS